MPKRSAVDSASPEPKRSKSSAGTANANSSKAADGKKPVSSRQLVDDNNDPYWELSSQGARRVTVNEFKGMVMVNLREYYEKDGKWLPGKKGISMPVDQFAALVEALPGIERALGEKGASVGRPDYEGSALDGNSTGRTEPRSKERVVDDDDEDMDGSGDNTTSQAKRNIDATSDEDSE